MQKRVPIYIVISFCILGLLLGALVLLGILPSKYVWGGRVSDAGQLVILELFTLVINLLIIWFVGMKANLFDQKISPKLLSRILWIIAILMFLNTIGNISAKTIFEKFMAIPTLLTAISIVYIIKKSEV